MPSNSHCDCHSPARHNNNYRHPDIQHHNYYIHNDREHEQYFHDHHQHHSVHLHDIAAPVRLHGYERNLSLRDRVRLYLPRELRVGVRCDCDGDGDFDELA